MLFLLHLSHGANRVTEYGMLLFGATRLKLGLAGCQKNLLQVIGFIE